MALIWTAWKSGKHGQSGVGYGLKVPIVDRDEHFCQEWQTVVLELPEENGSAEVEVNIAKKSFWNDSCHELISKKIGLWLQKKSLAPWPMNSPPRIAVELAGERRFRVIGVAN